MGVNCVESAVACKIDLMSTFVWALILLLGACLMNGAAGSVFCAAVDFLSDVMSDVGETNASVDGNAVSAAMKTTEAIIFSELTFKVQAGRRYGLPDVLDLKVLICLQRLTTFNVRSKINLHVSVPPLYISPPPSSSPLNK